MLIEEPCPKANWTYKDYADALEPDDLFGKAVAFDTYVFAVRATQQYTERTLEEMRPYLGYKPLRVIKETLRNTTKLARAVITFPLKRHFASRFPWLTSSYTRLKEMVSTDPTFAHTKARTGETCAQIYFGMRSTMINAIGMKSKKGFFTTYQDFLKTEGVPPILMRDNAPEQQSKRVLELN